jgi:hypothetical protein
VEDLVVHLEDALLALPPHLRGQGDLDVVERVQRVRLDERHPAPRPDQPGGDVKARVQVVDVVQNKEADHRVVGAVHLRRSLD